MLKAAEVVIAENAHGFYCVPRAAVQRPAALKIINGEVWEPETIDFVVRHCVDRSVVHAGACFGDFLPAVSRALVADAVLYAAEPNPENHASSLWTVRINGLRNVKLFRGALGRSASTADIIVKDEAGQSLGGWCSVGAPTAQIGAGGRVTAQVQSTDHLRRRCEVGTHHLDARG